MPENYRLKELREDNEMTQKQVAEKLYMQVTQYRRYESGEREPSLETAIAIAKLYNVSLDYLAGLIDIDNEITEKNITDTEKHIIAKFRKLSSLNKGKLLERLDCLIESQMKK